MSILPGATVKTPFYRYRATGIVICERCLTLDLACFPAETAFEIEKNLSCSCPHVWDGYAILNNAAITDHVKVGWEVGISASGVPCLSLCPPDLLALIEADKNIESSRAHKAVWNYVENRLRDASGLPRIGEGWVNETQLFRIVQSIFPTDEVIHHYRASWLGRLELDVYVVGADIGFEYQGIQHYEPQAHWGGLDALLRSQERDAEKARRCAAHGTKLIEIRYDEELTEASVREKIGEAAG